MKAIPNESTQRWAIVKAFRAGDDLHGAREVISSIQTRLAKDGPPDLKGLRNSPEERQAYSVEMIGPDAKAGMARGGPVCQVDGWGWRDEQERTLCDNRRPAKIISGLPVRNRRREAA